MAKNASPIVVALDGMEPTEAYALATRIKDLVWGFKVNDLLLREGIRCIETLARLGGVFADPKLHDTPQTMANSIRVLQDAGAQLITVHADAGPSSLTSAASAADSAQLLAVCALTSIDSDESQDFFGESPSERLLRLGRIAAKSGVQGLICSAHELQSIRNDAVLKDVMTVVPGIRPSSYQTADDQRRTMTPAEAMQLGASLLVIGRPITRAENPEEACASINREVKT